MIKLLNFEKFLNEKYFYKKNELIIEGGAYGHLMHPFEDITLTMGEILELINKTINGAFTPENFVQEKTDGQQLSVSWKNNKLIVARNRGHLKNRGENALDSEGLKQMFQGRGNLTIAFSNAIDDLENSISKLSEKDKKRFFDEGKKFISLEIITPLTKNVIPYGMNMIVFHGVVEYDKEGYPIKEDKQGAREIAKIIEKLNLNIQKMFYIRGPHDLKTKPFSNTKQREFYYKKKYNKILKENNLTSSSTVLDYVINRGLKLFKEILERKNFIIDEEILKKLIKRIVFKDKTYILKNLKNDVDLKIYKWYVEFEKRYGKEFRKKIYEPLENLFIEIGTEFMKNMTSFLVTNPTKATEEMRKEIEEAIEKIKKEGTEEQIKKLNHELKRIAIAGGLENIVPSEGITFVYKGKLYKYTGIFAPLNQIRGMLVY